MVTSASISIASMIELMEHMPVYSAYRSAEEAADAERIFRRALGAILKECGDRLLNVSDNRPQLLGAEENDTIDSLVNRIGAIFRRLDREGTVCLVGNCHATIAELEELDTRLILLIEEATALVHKLEADGPAKTWFNNDASRLSQDLDSFSEMAEERNYLLGLGWESEFTWPGRNES